MQKIFFAVLLKEDFRRTPFQLVFPGQTAGLVKKPDNGCVDEYHVRFYEEGTIDCEKEKGRFHSSHYAGPRTHQLELLEEILERNNLAINNLGSDYTEKIRQLFGEKHYSEMCVRKRAI